jgi:cytochrome c oxidase subunit 2
MGIFSIFPDRASTTAGQVDALYAFLLVVGIVMTIVIFFAVAFFAFKYRRKDPHYPPRRSTARSLSKLRGA